jgi:hypothetical protein
VFKKVMGVTPGKYAAGILKESEVVRGNPLDESLLEDRIRNPVVFQPWDEKLRADLDAWLMGDLDWDVGVGVGADVDNSLLWNDFDVLIAAEAEHVSLQDSGSLTGAPCTI